ncbi:amino acid adenylation domain-containing protein [Streptomyces sp. CAI-85]|uniref:non-ribosomal peptide synthetase family protein n=1 Tax=Streptomyces sp. CAI-85 TaxID=1472662 RepID=UPI0020CA4747|nr:amino acid adenylation domain-containing protein [Streptomyces sp. CAI-85]
MPTTELEAVRTTSTRTGETIPELLAEQVRFRPEDVAVVHRDRSYTYRRLADDSALVAAYLRHLGAGPDDRIGVLADPSYDLALGTWGILRAGSAYLPLSPDYPAERLRFMIEDARAAVVFVQEELRPRLRELAPADTRVVSLSDARAFGRAQGITGADDGTLPPLPSPEPHHLAYVIYTSGSTGRPKGVMIEHRSLANQLRWLHESHGLDERRRVLQKTPTSFDAAQWELLAPACGATVVMGEPGLYRDPDRMAEHIARHRITTLQCVPTLLRALLDLEETSRLASLDQLFSGGEILSRELARRCVETLPHATLVNLYGPTECTINSSSHTVDPAALREGPRAVPIGTPAAHTEYLILDERRIPVSAGEIGELYIGGRQLTRGYLLRPDLTAERFFHSPYAGRGRGGWLYRTGDLAYENPDGTVQYVGRADTQVKLRGYRIELDEIRLRIETHDWVRKAAVIVADDRATGHQNLLSYIELDPAEAALMDQGNHGAHHQSKAGKLQVRAQLADVGVRGPDELAGRPVTELPGREPTAEQRALVFGRKTYRFFEGGELRKDDVLRLLERRAPGAAPRDPADLTRDEWGHLLRYFGQYRSTERLLPKYGYASPGSLYATQLHLEHEGVAGLATGYSYYHPVDHTLVRIGERETTGRPGLRLHFTGRRRAIEPVYRNNILEVLEIETGHILGLFDEVLPGHGLRVVPDGYDPAVRDRLRIPDEDYYLGSFRIVPLGPDEPPGLPPLDVYVQAHPGRIAGLPAGQYAYTDGGLRPVSAELVQKKHVIAINQEVYDRASVGISVVSPTGPSWLRYVALGRELQRLQLNDLGIGLMSAGYSSKTGNPLPAARRVDHILTGAGLATGPSYFFVGGRVSEEQRRAEGMKEDVVHMRGPAEMIKDDLAAFLPDYMVPNRVTVLDALPLTPNGKTDTRALERLDTKVSRPADRPFTAPRTPTEERVAALWRKLLHRHEASVLDDFFETGGNSLVAVALVNRINNEFGTALPLQVLFDAPTVEKLARSVESARAATGEARPGLSRLVPLRPAGQGSTGRPVFCWPGLGGYPMNLRALAAETDGDRPFLGVQAHGVNAGEQPYRGIREMAAADAELILRTQPEGPYTLWGYSFGARVAFETAHQLEAAGHRVDHLNLIAPGSPRIRSRTAPRPDADGTARAADWGDPTFLTILYSVFAGRIDGPELADCLTTATGPDSFAAFVGERYPHLGAELVRRITEIVRLTYTFEYTFGELLEHRISAPVRVFKAAGDDYSFLDGVTGWSERPPVVVALAADHYGLLRAPGVHELSAAIRRLDHH